MRSLCLGILFSCMVTPFLGQAACDQEIVVNVRDSKGEFVSDLLASSFHAKVAGHDAPVTSAGVFAGANRVILVLDASGSMGNDGNSKRWNAIKNLAEQIVYFAPPSSRIALVIFNTTILEKLGFEHSRNELVAAIDRAPEAKGRTALWNSLLEATEMFGDVSMGDSMVVISDFGDDTHKPDAAKVQRALVAKGVRMFGIGIFDRYFSSEEEREGPESFVALANENGGDMIKFPLSSGPGGDVTRDIGELTASLPTILRWLSDKLSRFYVLRVTPSAPLVKRERLKLSLVVDNGKKNKGIVLYYSQHLIPCVH